MSTSDINDLLREYLEKRNSDEEQGFTLQNVLLTQNEILRTQQSMQAQLVQHGLRLDRHGTEIRIIKGVLRDKGIHTDPAWNGREEMTTGQWQLQDMQKQIEEAKAKLKAEEERRRENTTWWSRSMITWVVGGIGALIIATISGAGAYILGSMSKGK